MSRTVNKVVATDCSFRCRWRVEKLAGATFVAFGSAAPEISINVVGTSRGSLDLGIGAILG